MVHLFEFVMKWLQKFEKLWHKNKNKNKYVWKWLVKLNFKPTFPLEVWFILLEYLNVRTYKYILKLHCVENGKYPIIHLF